MKIFQTHIVLFYVLLIMVSCKQKNLSSTQSPSKDQSINKELVLFQKALLSLQIDSIINETNFNGNVAIFQDTMKLYERFRGFENFQNQKKLSKHSVFAIGSISKQFTAVAVLRLVEQHRISLDEKVAVYLEDFNKPHLKNIKIKQLLNHTSGLLDNGGWIEPVGNQSFNYSNRGFYTLGRLIEKVSGKSLEENFHEIFTAAGLKETFLPSDKGFENFAGANLGNNKAVVAVQNMPQRLEGKEIGVAAGGILSTVADLHRWNQALYGGKLLPEEYLQKMLSASAKRDHPIFGEMGYGYGMMQNLKVPLCYFHSGYVKGAPSLNVYYPDTKTSVIILSNLADENKGKNYIFRPHQDIKKINDQIQLALAKIVEKASQNKED